MTSTLTTFKVLPDDYGESVTLEHDCEWTRTWTWREVATLAAFVDAAEAHLRETHPVANPALPLP